MRKPWWWQLAAGKRWGPRSRGTPLWAALARAEEGAQGKRVEPQSHCLGSCCRRDVLFPMSVCLVASMALRFSLRASARKGRVTSGGLRSRAGVGLGLAGLLRSAGDEGSAAAGIAVRHRRMLRDAPSLGLL